MSPMMTASAALTENADSAGSFVLAPIKKAAKDVKAATVTDAPPWRSANAMRSASVVSNGARSNAACRTKQPSAPMPAVALYTSLGLYSKACAVLLNSSDQAQLQFC